MNDNVSILGFNRDKDLHRLGDVYFQKLYNFFFFLAILVLISSCRIARTIWCKDLSIFSVLFNKKVKLVCMYFFFNF